MQDTSCAHVFFTLNSKAEIVLAVTLPSKYNHRNITLCVCYLSIIQVKLNFGEGCLCARLLLKDYKVKGAEVTCVEKVIEMKICFRLKDMLNFNVL